MRHGINVLEETTRDAELRRLEMAALHQAERAALDAFDADRTRANLERVWAIRKERDAFQAEHYPAPEPVPEPVPKDGDYRGQHQAPGHEGGSPLFDLTRNGVYPDDFYTGRAREYLGDSDDRMELAALSLVMAARNRPNMPVTIYRSVPKTVPRVINPGDWVSISRKYAVDHGHHALNGSFSVVQKRVFARDTFTEGNSILEWGYDPQPRVVKPRTA